MKSLIAKLLIGMINPELIKSLVGILLSMVEAAVKSTETDWDDKNIMPIVDKLKKSLT